MKRNVSWISISTILATSLLFVHGAAADPTQHFDQINKAAQAVCDAAIAQAKSDYATKDYRPPNGASSIGIPKIAYDNYVKALHRQYEMTKPLVNSLNQLISTMSPDLRNLIKQRLKTTSKGASAPVDKVIFDRLTAAFASAGLHEGFTGINNVTYCKTTGYEKIDEKTCAVIGLSGFKKAQKSIDGQGPTDGYQLTFDYGAYGDSETMGNPGMYVTLYHRDEKEVRGNPTWTNFSKQNCGDDACDNPYQSTQIFLDFDALAKGELVSPASGLLGAGNLGIEPPSLEQFMKDQVGEQCSGEHKVMQQLTQAAAATDAIKVATDGVDSSVAPTKPSKAGKTTGQ
jgi:hypothetical protein